MRDLEATIKGLEAQVSDLKSVVMAAMGEADTLVLPDGKKLATWKSAKDTTKTNWEKVAKVLGAHEEPTYVDRIIAENTETKPGARRFLLAKVNA